METTNFYNLIILDESGSMGSIRNAAVSGCNETLQSIRAIQKKYEGTQNHFVSLVTFSSMNSTNVILDKVPVSKTKDITKSSYRPNGCTPLYDAIGLSCKLLQSTMDKTKKSCVLVTIITDGYENSSQVFNLNKVRSMIDELKTSGWTFAYIGANQDVLEESRILNIDQCLSFETTEKGSGKMFCKMNRAQAKVADCWAEKDSNLGNIFDSED